MRIVIVGCGDAGLSAAFAAARQDPTAEITVISEEEKYYPRCPLPYLIGGNLSEKDLIKDLDLMFKGTRIKLVIDHAVRLSKDSIECEDNTIPFNRAVVATGGHASQIPGSLALRTLKDARDIQRLAKDAKEIVIVGGGMLGCELADMLGGTIVEKDDRILPNFDREFADVIAANLKAKGVKISTGTKEIPESDLVISCIGVEPNLELARNSGIKASSFGMIVGDHLQTNRRNVYAAGDCIEEWCFISKQPMHSYLGPQAEREGVIAGVNAAGGDMAYLGSLNAVAAKIGEVEIGRTGMSSADAERHGIKTVVGRIDTKTKPEYERTARELMIKMVFKNRRLIGCQALGGEGVDGIINLASYAIQHHASIDDLMSLGYCFSPPICSAPNPIVLCAENAKRRMTR
ncbi:MAG: FAD-dependent oxidoreductase [Candidatus Altiarchaeota archaeon]|nr:FAD-dependent oxidoreductase [Candidatus Altiarchaeota archaeon]